MGKLKFYIDGASKGNPGPSGIGVVVCRDGETIKNIASFLNIFPLLIPILNPAMVPFYFLFLVLLSLIRSSTTSSTTTIP